MESFKSRELLELVNRVISSFKAHVTVLTGSKAQREYKPLSDYDPLVVADPREKYLVRIKNILGKISNTRLSIVLHPNTLGGMKEMQKYCN